MIIYRKTQIMCFSYMVNNSDKENSDVRRSLKEVPQNRSLILVATGQYIGRLNRDYIGKEEVIVYDYIDSYIHILDHMYAKRLLTYKRTGFQVIPNDILTK